MSNRVYLKSTVTGKRQITIPKEVCDELMISSGDQVIFREEDGKIIFEKEVQMVTCYACKGSGHIDGYKCFLCDGEGQINKNLESDYLEIHLQLLKSFNKNGLRSLQLLTQFRDLPVIRIKSDNFKRETLDFIEDEILKRIVINQSSRGANGKGQFEQITEANLENILSDFKTQSARDEVKLWLKNKGL